MEDLKSGTINIEVGKSLDKIASVLNLVNTGYAKLKKVITNYYVVVEPDKQKSVKIFL